MTDQLTLVIVFFVVLGLYVALRRVGGPRLSTRRVFALAPLRMPSGGAITRPDAASLADAEPVTFVLRGRSGPLPLYGVHRVGSALGFVHGVAGVGNLLWSWGKDAQSRPVLSLVTLDPLSEADRVPEALERVLEGTTPEVSLVFSVSDTPVPEQVLDRALLTAVELLRALDAELLVDGRVVDIAQARNAILPRFRSATP